MGVDAKSVESSTPSMPERKPTPILVAESDTKTDADVLQTDSSEDEEHGEYMEGKELLVLVLGLLIVMFLCMLDMSIISTAIPQITSDFSRLEDVGWYVGAYQLASATVQPLAGKLYLYFSVKWTWFTFFVIFMIGSAICGAAPSSVALIVGRVVGGLGYSGISNGTMIIFVGAFPLEKRPLYTAIILGMSQIGVVLGPLLGGVFTEYLSWRWCFYINLPIGGVGGLLLLFCKIPENTRKQPVTLSLLRSVVAKLDLPGFLLFTPAAVMFLMALQFGSSDYHWSSPVVIGMFCGAGVGAILFLAWEWRMGADAMIPLALLAKRTLWTSALNFSFVMSATLCAAAFMPIFFQSVLGLSPTMSGVYSLASILSQILFILISGALMTKLGYYMPWALLAGAGGAVGLGLISTWTPGTSLGLLLGYQVIYGIRGVGLQVGVIAIQSTLKPAEATIGTSILVFFQNFMVATFVAIANVIFQETLISEIRSIVPPIDPQTAIGAGGSAAAVRALAPAGSDQLAALLDAYTAGFRNVMYLGVGISIVAFLVAFGMGWVDIRKVEDPKKKKQLVEMT
ncbi:hypothetical protein S40293_04495 [Stachybotrys chartarum IBT 40293]|nr:hypothetical protein S40293_04495 [Stachybotrys chartarum IBT 40293]